MHHLGISALINSQIYFFEMTTKNYLKEIFSPV